MTYLPKLFWLLVGHAVCDFALQSDTMAKLKNYRNTTSPPVGQQPCVVWPYFLGAHALIHGCAVALVTGSVALGLAEAIIHFTIDLAKCAGLIRLHQDQTMHFGCKLLWASL